ncbi:MAG TPA: pantoate--beta-alanine ligase [Crocinitomicaceae bacterium]|nr:pantoate--beta-alanine ligase [Crocinitomicaceae bacterium]
MLIISTVSDLLIKITELKNSQKSIGFVPTMGALHLGHGSLMEQSISENDISIVSIFVNPRQFNNPTDLEKYPRTIESDIDFLKNVGVDIVFIPTVADIYSEDFVAPKVALGQLELLMEGKMRPGHFDGVVQVLTRLFALVQPTNAYFGLKDFQQVAVVKKLVAELQLPINIVACPIYREKSGLAFSSRNQRLSEDDKKKAVFIYQSLLKSKEFSNQKTPQEIMKMMQELYAQSELELEYFEIVNPLTLNTLTDDWVKNSVACVVAYIGGVRLIDNMALTT